MIINLQEIPPEGKEYVCNQNTQELNTSLKDLIGNAPHAAHFTIRPTSPGTYELVGVIKTQLPELCSHCGLDFQFQVQQKFQEILLPSLKQPRGSKYQKANHFSDLNENERSASEYQGNHFDMGAFLYQVVALSVPFYPSPPETEKGDCSLCNLQVRGKTFAYEDQGFEEEEKKSPFSVLKGLKIN